ncbi:SRPBCC domain-containing protein [Panacibacter sp. DH6]|uniref:SRPBCC domain-containing protein n=1 Tax=Panacibacter microcysteis TaxID=2793269 RepID=A0A931E662_9BACT|nr:SRPBCC domain-containing protein [Panacibacter microcysteis]MBG9377778.1 SRPBCC domain-containing protein [Panacibacter microcysteis]
MEKITLSVNIEAPKEKVWKILWSDDTYRKWTAVFSEGSHVVTDNWKQDSKVLFLDGNGCGMVSRVAANRPNEFMSFEHLGEVKDGAEDTTSERVKQWSGSKENYTLTETGNNTLLQLDMDITEDFKDYFLNTCPAALQNVKQLAEAE